MNEMLTPIPGQITPSDGSSKLIRFNCSCGRTNIEKRWRNYKSGKTTSCGKCSLLTKEYFENTKFGNLIMKEPGEYQPSSNVKTKWLCDCGKEITNSVIQVVSGKATSCGKCSLLTEEYLEVTKFGKLRVKNPEPLSPNSHKKIPWICDCGNEINLIISNVISGKTKSCGKCSLLTKEHFEIAKYGKLRMKNPSDFMPKSEKRTTWICDCGGELETKVCYVVSGETTSCGKCWKKNNWIDKEFGKIRIIDESEISPGSHKLIKCVCRCGNEFGALAFNVSRGFHLSCGNCYERAFKWFVENEPILKSLNFPIQPNQIPIGWTKALELVVNNSTQFAALCGACESVYKPTWERIKSGRSLTCGCTNNKISGAAREISRFIESFGLSTDLEYEINQYKYDIFIESKNLVIEYNGLIWHASDEAKKRDLSKYRLAKNNGFDYLMIFEDEWLKDRELVKNLIKNRLGLNKSFKSLRPNQCEIRLIKASETSNFYSKYHYIGPCKAKFNYGIYYNEIMIGCASFGNPTRQSSYQFELLRMASDPNYRAHGIWNVVLKRFISENNAKSVVSFSDNRLFNGKIYEILGFKKDGGVKPDYYWVKNGKRFNKSGLRVKKELGITENDLRRSQGYSKIWDLGKTRWIKIFEFS